VQLSIQTNFPSIQKQLEQMREDIASKATARAINRTIEQARTDMSREIRQEFVLTADEVRSQLKIRRATFKTGKLEITAALIGGKPKGRSLNMIRFVKKVVTLAAARRRMKAGEGGRQQLKNGGYNNKALELEFKIKRTGPAKRVKGAFIGNKGRTVFVRQKGSKRLPIDALRTIDVAQMFNAKRINRAVVNKMQAKFPEIFAREVAFYTKKFGGRG
jgi:hypothetical protein